MQPHENIIAGLCLHRAVVGATLRLGDCVCPASHSMLLCCCFVNTHLCNSSRAQRQLCDAAAQKQVRDEHPLQNCEALHCSLRVASSALRARLKDFHASFSAQDCPDSLLMFDAEWIGGGKVELGNRRCRCDRVAGLSDATFGGV